MDDRPPAAARPGAANLAFHNDSLSVSAGSIAGVWRLDIGVRGAPLFAEL